MSTVAKILVVLNLILAAAFVGSAASYLGHQDHWKQQYDDREAQLLAEIDDKNKALTETKDQLAQAKQAHRDANDKLTASEAENRKMTAENQHLREHNDQQSAQLTRATAALEAMTQSLDSNRTLIDQLQSENKKLHEANVAVQQDRDAAVEQGNRLEMQLNNETETRKSVEGRLAQLNADLERANFELAAWRNRYPGGVVGAEQPAQNGQINAANNSANVYVISLGAEDGVKAGFQYVVSRGGEYVATIQINDVQAKQSAGFALKGYSKGEIRQGDRIMNR